MVGNSNHLVEISTTSIREHIENLTELKETLNKTKYTSIFFNVILDILIPTINIPPIIFLAKMILEKKWHLVAIILTIICYIILGVLLIIKKNKKEKLKDISLKYKQAKEFIELMESYEDMSKLLNSKNSDILEKYSTITSYYLTDMPKAEKTVPNYIKFLNTLIKSLYKVH